MRFLRRRSRRRDPGGDAEFVIGQQMADAIEADERHRAQHGALASPLEGARYSAGSGDVHRFVESPVDGRLQEFAGRIAGADRDQLARWRAALDIDDLYTLLAFTRRAALAHLTGRAEPSLDAALHVLLMVDQERVDWRDLSVATELLAWVLVDAGRDHSAELAGAAERLGLPLEDAVLAAARRPAGELEPGRYRRIETPAGPALADTLFEPFDPTVDIVAAAFAVQDVVERDEYRVDSFTVDGDLPDVWLVGRDAERIRSALAGIRATVQLSAALGGAASSTADDQQFSVFLSEAASEADAATLAAAARPTEFHEALGVAEGPLCCVVVARSFVIGVEAYEGPGALARFSSPLATALRGLLARY